jgi:hypothetical protein
MGLNTKHEQVGGRGSADASKTQKHRQVGGRVLITQNTQQQPQTQNPAGAGARPPHVRYLLEMLVAHAGAGVFAE